LVAAKLCSKYNAALLILHIAPKAEQKLEEWQTATGCMIGAAEGRDFLMHARIGVTGR